MNEELQRVVNAQARLRAVKDAAKHDVDECRAELVEAMRQAAKTNSIRAIADTANLSPTRVHQIIHGRQR